MKEHTGSVTWRRCLWRENLTVSCVEQFDDQDGTPLNNALVEVFNKPEYLLVEQPVNKRGRSNQRRVAVCRTGLDGRFCFFGLPAGKYELRSSSDDTGTGWNASQVYVIVNPRTRRKKQLNVEMTLGI